MPKHSPAEQRFWSKVDLDFETGCWNWTASKHIQGYGMFYPKHDLVLAHRFSYELLKDRIPEGLTIDHLCRNTSCVNPDHLEAVTQKENVLRGIGVTSIHAKKTHCIRGHELQGNNVYIRPNGNRYCRKCKYLSFNRCKNRRMNIEIS